MNNQQIIGLLLILVSLTGCSECSRSGRNAELARAQRERGDHKAESDRQLEIGAAVNRTDETSTSSTQVSHSEATILPMTLKGGVYYVKVGVNGMELDFVFDTGASSILISQVEFLTLKRQGRAQDSDLGEVQYFLDASGDTSEAVSFNIRELKLGDRILNDVDASIGSSLSAPLLLGQSALARFGKVEIDYQNSRIVIK